MTAIFNSLDWTWITACILGLIGVVYFPWRQLICRWKISRFPGPNGVPLFGVLFDLWGMNREDLLPIMAKYWDEYSKDGLFKYVLLHRVFVQLCKPEYVQVILGDSEQTQKSTDYDTLTPWLGHGLLISSGAKWHTRRKLLTPSFHFRNLETFMDVINEQSKILVEQLHSEVGKEPFSIFPYISRCTLDIICETAMGRSIEAQKNHSSEYLEAVDKMAEIANNRNIEIWLAFDWIFNNTAMGKEQERCLRILHGFTNQVIKEKKLERQENREMYSKNEDISSSGKRKRQPFLDLLLDSADNGRVLSDEDVREEVDTFMFAGHDTTATALCWTLYLLGHNPEIQEKLRNELDHVIGTDDEVTSKHIPHLKYLEQVMKESLRIYPPAPFMARYLTKDMKFGEYVAPAGAMIVLMPYCMHRDPATFPNPEKFDPDRFLPDEIQKRHPFSFIPFSAGPRNCIGQKFALLEEKIVLSHLLRSYKITSVQPREKIELTADIILRAKDGIFLRLESL